MSGTRKGDERAAAELSKTVYGELRALARKYLSQERTGHTLQPTALVHEAYLHLVDQRADWRSRTQFFAAAAQAMRRILVDHARRRNAAKRGGHRRRVDLDAALVVSPSRDEDLLAANEALEKLFQVDARQAKLVELRVFGGLTVAEAAEVLDISKRTAEREWTMVRAWLRRELSRPQTA